MTAIEQWRAVIADDHEVTRSGVRLMIDILPDIEVVREVGNGAELVAACAELRPDVVLTDIEMPVMDGIEATAKVKEANPDVAVLVLTVHEDGDKVFEAMRAGASGYLSKAASADHVKEAIAALRTGGTYLTPEVAGIAVRALTRRVERSDRTKTDQTPTPREREVLGLVATGMSARSIARQLGISERTVNTHIGHVYRKLGVNNRVDAVLAGMRLGLVDGPG